MNLYWTSKKSINGFKHFVLINEYKVKNETILELVSVLDIDVKTLISKKEIKNSQNWHRGWTNCQKSNIVVSEYKDFKKKIKDKEKNKIFIKNDSPFNIS